MKQTGNSMKKVDFEILFIAGLLLLVGFVIGILTKNLLNNQKEQKALIEKLQEHSEVQESNDVHLFQKHLQKSKDKSKVKEYKPVHMVTLS